MTKTINKAIKIRDKGVILKILLERKKEHEEKLDLLNNMKFFTESDLTIDFLNGNGRNISTHIINRLTNINYIRESQTLGKKIVNELNNFNTKCIDDLIDISKTHIQLKIEQIELIIKRII